MDGREFDGHKLYVKAALNKEERKTELMHETFKYKNSKKRCNLYVKGFPASTTEEDLRALFAKYGEIESLKLFPIKDQKNPFAFVCYKIADLVVGLRVSEEEEREGLDISSHGESAYRM